jgi:hypothetical protein
MLGELYKWTDAATASVVLLSFLVELQDLEEVGSGGQW